MSEQLSRLIYPALKYPTLIRRIESTINAPLRMKITKVVAENYVIFAIWMRSNGDDGDGPYRTKDWILKSEHSGNGLEVLYNFLT